MISSFFRNLFPPDSDISEEKMEEYKYLSGFQQKDIVKLRKVFLENTGRSETMTKGSFTKIGAIALNPLLDRLCLCFGLEDENATLNFDQFLVGVAAFNAPGRGEIKIKTAFKIQDFDGDGSISKQDLTEYIKRITINCSETERDEIVNEVFRETSSDPKQELISFADFQRVVILVDFHAKIHLSIC